MSSKPAPPPLMGVSPPPQFVHTGASYQNIGYVQSPTYLAQPSQPLSMGYQQPMVTVTQPAEFQYHQPIQQVEVVPVAMSPRPMSPPPQVQEVITRIEITPAPPPEIIERIVEVEVIKEVPVERIVEVPVDRIVDRYVEVPVEKVTEKVREVEVDRIITKEVPVEIERLVEKVVVKEVPVPVEKIVEKIVEVPVEKIVYQDRIVYQDQVVYQDRVVEVPVERVVQYNQPREGPSIATGMAFVREYSPQQMSVTQGNVNVYRSQSKMVGSVGLGLLLRKNENHQTCIKETFPGYAAQRSGKVSPGDVILSVDGRQVENMDLEYIKNITIGEEGSTCVLTLKRDNSVFDVPLQRIHPEGITDGRSAEVYHSISRPAPGYGYGEPVLRSPNVAYSGTHPW